MADQMIADDLMVQSSLRVGFDLTVQAWFETMRIKETSGEFNGSDIAAINAQIGGFVDDIAASRDGVASLSSEGSERRAWPCLLLSDRGPAAGLAVSVVKPAPVRPSPDLFATSKKLPCGTALNAGIAVQIDGDGPTKYRCADGLTAMEEFGADILAKLRGGTAMAVTVVTIRATP